MLKKCVVIFCLLSLIGFVSCKKSKSDGAVPVDDQILNEIFGGGDSGGGDYLADDSTAGTACNNNGECDTGETNENCAADCPTAGGKGNQPLEPVIDFAPNEGKVTFEEGVGLGDEPRGEIGAELDNYAEDYEMVFSLSDDAGIDVDPSDENDEKFLITAYQEGEYEIAFQAIAGDDTTNVLAEDTFKVIVKSCDINLDDISVEKQMVIGGEIPDAVLVGDGCSGEYGWTVQMADESAGSIELEVFEEIDDDENVQTLVGFTPLAIGEHTLIITATDNNIVDRSKSKEITITATENKSANAYRAAIDGIEDGATTYLDSEFTLLKRSDEDGDKIDDGYYLGRAEGIAILVPDGAEKVYRCSLDSSSEDKFTIHEVEETIDGETQDPPVMIQGVEKRLACIIAPPVEKVIEGSNVDAENVTVTVTSDFSEPAKVELDKVVFRIDPCQTELEIQLEASENTYESNDDESYIFVNGVKLGVSGISSLSQGFQVAGGKGPYFWKVESKVFGAEDDTWQAGTSDATSYAQCEDAANESWGFEYGNNKVRDIATLTGLFQYEYLPVGGLGENQDPYEELVIQYKDSCDGREWQAVTARNNISYPSLGDVKVDDLRIKMKVEDINDVWNNGKSWMKVRLLEGDDLIGVHKYDLGKCEDDDSVCENYEWFDFSETDVSGGDASAAEKMGLSEIDDIKLHIHDAQGGSFWGAFVPDPDCDVITIRFETDFYYAIYWDDTKGDDEHPGGVSGKGLNDDVVGGDEDKHVDLKQYMLPQAGESESSHFKYVWKRRQRLKHW